MVTAATQWAATGGCDCATCSDATWRVKISRRPVLWRDVVRGRTHDKSAGEWRRAARAGDDLMFCLHHDRHDLITRAMVDQGVPGLAWMALRDVWRREARDITKAIGERRDDCVLVLWLGLVGPDMPYVPNGMLELADLDDRPPPILTPGTVGWQHLMSLRRRDGCIRMATVLPFGPMPRLHLQAIEAPSR